MDVTAIPMRKMLLTDVCILMAFMKMARGSRYQDILAAVKLFCDVWTESNMPGLEREVKMSGLIESTY